MIKAALSTTTWHKSSYSNATGNCVEVAPTTHGIFVRHSKYPTIGTIIFSVCAWLSFIREVRAGGASANGSATVTRVGTDTLVRSLHSDIELRFDQDEWAAFIAGAAAGEFNFTHHLAAA